MKLTKEAVLSNSQYDTLLTELDTLRASVILDADPISVGFDEINRKLSVLQASRDRVSAIVCDAIINKNFAQRLQNSKQASFDRKSSSLFMTSDTVKASKSADLRKAAVESQLSKDLGEVNDAAEDLGRADTFLKCASAVAKDLEIKNENLVQQTYVIQMILKLHSPAKGELH